MGTTADRSIATGKVEMVAMFLEGGGFDESLAARVKGLPSGASARGVEHRSAPFVFDLERWS